MQETYLSSPDKTPSGYSGLVEEGRFESDGGTGYVLKEH